MIIDIHTHTFPDKIAADALAAMQSKCRIHAFTDATMNGLLRSTRNSGIDLSVVQPVATNPNKVSSINDLSITLSKQENLLYFGCIHPDMPDWEAEMNRIAAAGIKGIKIHPFFQDTNIVDIRYLRILEKAGQLGLIVLTHAGDDIGFPGQVRCSPSMILSALQQVGPVQMILAHMGGWRNWREVLSLLVDTSVYLDTAFSLGKITPLHDGDYQPHQLPLLDDQSFCEIVRAFGAHRILFGTDSPWADQAKTLDHFCSLPLSEGEKQAILGENARKLLQI